MTRTAPVPARRAIGFVSALALSAALLFGCATGAPSESGTASNGGSTNAPSSSDAPSSQQKTVQIKEGVEAPDFEFTTHDGETAKLSDYRGKVVLLNFWATWCGYCIREMPALGDIAATYPDVAVLAINRGDSPDKAKSGAEEIGQDLIWGLDEDGAIAKLYPANGIPYSVVIDKEGKVSSIFEGSAPDMYPYFEEAVVKAGA